MVCLYDNRSPETEQIKVACRQRNLPLYLTEHADHSMETGDVEQDLLIMRDIMQKTAAYMDEQ